LLAIIGIIIIVVFYLIYIYYLKPTAGTQEPTKIPISIDKDVLEQQREIDFQGNSNLNCCPNKGNIVRQITKHL